MVRTERLPLTRPIALAGAREGIWIADADSASAALFDAASARVISRVSLDEAPVAISATADVIAIALRTGEIVALAAASGTALWRRWVSSGDVQLMASRDRVWAWDRRASTFRSWDRAGTPEMLDASGAIAFAPAANGVYWLSAAGLVGFQPRAGGRPASATLPETASPTGALVPCANALWISIANALLLLNQRTLDVRSTLTAPEGPVPHLVCFNNRLFGGLRTVFALEPASDDNARALMLDLQRPLQGLAVSGTHLWAMESAGSTVHIFQIP